MPVNKRPLSLEREKKKVHRFRRVEASYLDMGDMSVLEAAHAAPPTKINTAAKFQSRVQEVLSDKQSLVETAIKHLAKVIDPVAELAQQIERSAKSRDSQKEAIMKATEEVANLRRSLDDKLEDVIGEVVLKCATWSNDEDIPFKRRRTSHDETSSSHVYLHDEDQLKNLVKDDITITKKVASTTTVVAESLRCVILNQEKEIATLKEVARATAEVEAISKLSEYKMTEALCNNEKILQRLESLEGAIAKGKTQRTQSPARTSDNILQDLNVRSFSQIQPQEKEKWSDIPYPKQRVVATSSSSITREKSGDEHSIPLPEDIFEGLETNMDRNRRLQKEYENKKISMEALHTQIQEPMSRENFAIVTERINNMLKSVKTLTGRTAYLYDAARTGGASGSRGARGAARGSRGRGGPARYQP
jgi:hypothetical protein